MITQPAVQTRYARLSREQDAPPYPAAMATHRTDIIPLDVADTLATVFQERVRRSPNAPAYRQFNESTGLWQTWTWSQVAECIGRWQAALRNEGLAAGDRVALMLRNCREWAMFDLAAQGLGLVTVPIYTNDRAENIGYILQDAGVKLFLVEGGAQWTALKEIEDQLAGLRRILTMKPVKTGAVPLRLTHVDDWLPAEGAFEARPADSRQLATIVYTSGTTGRAKGVMLSHRNILWDISAGLKAIDVYPDDLFLSFLPLSHTLERTIGYYLPIVTGSCVAYARSIPQLAEDLMTVRPTILISVPRIFERIHARIRVKLGKDPAPVRALFNKAVDVGWRRFEYQQGRGSRSLDFALWPILARLVATRITEKLGGRLRFAISGGAPLSTEIARMFIGLGVPVVQGYGLTETSPVIAVNRLEDNLPSSVGRPLPGIEIKLGENDELLTRSPAVMRGYWNNPEATAEIIDAEGWLRTGDRVSIDARGHITITGRLKEIIVLATGEKVPPADMEMAILMDSLFEQVLVLGEGRPYLTALVVLNPDHYRSLAQRLDLDPDAPETLQNAVLKNTLLDRLQAQLHSFPGYARIRDIGMVDTPWTTANGLMTPTLKLRRSRILEKYATLVDSLYEGH